MFSPINIKTKIWKQTCEVKLTILQLKLFRCTVFQSENQIRQVEDFTLRQDNKFQKAYLVCILYLHKKSKTHVRFLQQ